MNSMAWRRHDRLKIANAFWRGLDAIGLTPASVLRHARLPATLGASNVAILSLEQYFALWDAVGALSDDPAVGIALGDGIDITWLPPAFLSALYARDLREALATVARFKSLCSPETVTMIETGETCTIELQWPAAGSQVPMALVDAAFAAFVKLARTGTNHLVRPFRVEVVALEASPRRGAFFGCEVVTGAAQDRLVLSRRDLDRPFRTHNADMIELLQPQLHAALEDHRASATLSSQVKWTVKRLLPGNTPELDAVAREMGMSARTLQRRMGHEGTTFRALLLEARQELVRVYLRDASIDATEVAYLLGYDDPNSFYRAFRDWEGLPLARWRALQ